MLTKDTNYSCHIKAIELCNDVEFISRHITPLVVHNLGGGHTHTHMHAYNSKKPGVRWPRLAYAWFKNRKATMELKGTKE